MCFLLNLIGLDSILPSTPFVPAIFTSRWQYRSQFVAASDYWPQ